MTPEREDDAKGPVRQREQRGKQPVLRGRVAATREAAKPRERLVIARVYEPSPGSGSTDAVQQVQNRVDVFVVR